MGNNQRRRFLVTLGVLLAPWRAVAQHPGRVYRISVLFNGGSGTWGPYRDALRERLAQQGFVEGGNLQMKWWGTSGIRHEDRAAAREMVATRPDAILAYSSRMAQAAQWATKSIPVIFTSVGDPIADGLVKDYARPGGNITGVSTHRELLVKRFELLRELAPNVKRVAYMSPADTEPDVAASAAIARTTAARLGLELVEVHATNYRLIEESRAEAMLVYSVLGQRITTENYIGLAARLRIPSIFPDADSVLLGGLASYGTDSLDDTRLAADQLARVLRGSKPGEVSVEQSSRFVLAINMKTARAIGLKVPELILLRADRVIE